MGRKPKTSDPKTTLGATVPPEFEAMIESIGKAMVRTKGWLGGRLMVRGYLAILEGERLLSDDEIDNIVSDKQEFERVLAHAKYLLAIGAPSDRPKLNLQAAVEADVKKQITDLDALVSEIMQQSKTSGLSEEQMASTIIEGLRARGLKVQTADEWAKEKENTGPDVIDLSIENYLHKDG